jgi:hypothetical protein
MKSKLFRDWRLLLVVDNDLQLVSHEPFGDVYHHTFPQYHQDVYYVGDRVNVKSYVAIEDRSGYLWLLETFTEPQHRGANLSPQLIQWVVKRLGKMLVDLELTPIAARMIERMIAAGTVSASIVDLQAGNVTTYNPNDPTDQAKPMYDQPVSGVNRPQLPAADANNYTWMLESRMPRRGILAAYHKRL